MQSLKTFYLATLLGLRSGTLGIDQFAGQSVLRVPYSLAIALGVALWMWGKS